MTNSVAPNRQEIAETAQLMKELEQSLRQSEEQRQKMAETVNSVMSPAQQEAIDLKGTTRSGGDVSTSGFNEVPQVPEVTLSAKAGEPQVISVDQLVVQAEGHPVEIVDVSLVDPSQGKIVLAADGQSFEFIPAEGFTGEVQVSVSIAESGNAVVGYDLTADQRADLRENGMLAVVESTVNLSVGANSYSTSVMLPNGEDEQISHTGGTADDALAAIASAEFSTISGHFDKAPGFTGEVTITYATNPDGTAVKNADGTYTLTATDSAGLTDTMNITLGTPTPVSTGGAGGGESITAIAIDQWAPTEGETFSATGTTQFGTAFTVETGVTSEEQAVKLATDKIVAELVTNAPLPLAPASVTTSKNEDGSYTVAVRDANTGLAAYGTFTLSPSLVPSTVNEDGLTREEWQAAQQPAVFTTDDLRTPGLEGFEVESFSANPDVVVTTNPDGTFQVVLAPDAIGTRDVTVTWKDPATGEVATSTLRVQGNLAGTAPPETVDIGVETSLGTQDQVHILYRADGDDTWVEIAVGSDGIAPNGSFQALTEADLASGEYILVKGDGTGAPHPLVGTNAPPPADAVVATAETNETGVKLTFADGPDSSAAIVHLTDPRKTAEPEPVEFVAPANSDASADTAFVSRRDYTYEFSFTYTEERNDIGSDGGDNFSTKDTSSTVSVAITADMVVDQATADATSLEVGQSISSGLTKTQLDEWATHLATTQAIPAKTEELNDADFGLDEIVNVGAPVFVSATSSTYTTGDNVLVGFGHSDGTDASTDMTAQTPAAFFIRGDNEILLGQNGDTLGVIRLETYPSQTEVVSTSNSSQGNIVLTSAYSVDSDTGALDQDLSGMFFIRPGHGLNGEFEIGLEADQALVGDFEGKTIVLEVQATDASGKTYTTKVYFNPTTQTIEGQASTSLDYVRHFETESTLPGIVTVDNGALDPNDPVFSANDSFNSTIDGIAQDLVNNEPYEEYYTPPSKDEYVGMIKEDIVLTAVPTEVPVDGSLVTYEGAEANFGQTIVGTFGPTLDVSWDYTVGTTDLDLQKVGGDNYTGTIGPDTRPVEEITISAGTSEADRATFDLYFDIVKQPDGSHQIVQTKYIDPTTPINVTLDIQLYGGVTVTTEVKINDGAILLPGHDIQEAIDNPDLVESNAVPTGLLGEALTDVNGEYNVVIGGKEITPELLNTLSAEFAGIVPELLADEAALKELLTTWSGVTDPVELDKMVAELRDAHLAHTFAAGADGFVSTETTDAAGNPVTVPTVMELLASDRFLGADGLDSVFTGKREEIIAEYFPGYSPAEISGQLIGQLLGLEVVDGAFTGEAAPSTLSENVAGFDETEREQFGKHWLGLASMIDGEVSTNLFKQLESDPEAAAALQAETFGALVDSSGEYAEDLGEQFAVYFADGELTQAEIDEIIANPELLEQFLLSVQGSLMTISAATGVDNVLVPMDVAVDGSTAITTFAEGVMSHYQNLDKFSSDKNLTTEQAAAQGLLLLLSEGGSFQDFTANLSADTALGLTDGVFGAGQQFTNIDAYKDEVKKVYGGNRGDSVNTAANTFFSFGRIAALVTGGAMAQGATPAENIAVAIDILNVYGTSEVALRRLAEYLSTGDAAEQIAANSPYYIAKEKDGEVKLVAAELGDKVTDDPAAIQEYSDKRTLLRSLEQEVGADGTPTGFYLGIDANGDAVVMTADERKALAKEVSSKIYVADDGNGGGAGLYNKVESKTSYTARGEMTEKLNKGVDITFKMDATNAALIIEKGLGNQVKINDKDFFVEQDMLDKAIAFTHQAEHGDALMAAHARGDTSIVIDGKTVAITDELVAAFTVARAASGTELSLEMANSFVAAGVGKSVTIDGVKYTVTDELLVKSNEVIAGGSATTTIVDEAGNTEVVPYKVVGEVEHHRTGASSITQRVYREFFGADQIGQGAGRIASAFGPKALNDDLTRLDSLFQRGTDVTAGTLRIAAGLGRAAGNWVDFAAIGLDIFNVVTAFQGNDPAAKGLSVANLAIGVASTAVTLGALLGPAVIGAAAFAALGPLGVALIAASVVLVLVETLVVKPDAPTNAEIYGELAGFLLGENSLGPNGDGVNLLKGAPNVIFDDSYEEITLVNGELRIPTDVTKEELGQFLGDQYDKGGSDWILQFLGMQNQYATAA